MKPTKFKDHAGRYFTTGLFKETAVREKKYVLYTMEEARQCYLECNDITGYSFATGYLGGWDHWLAFQKSPIVMSYVNKWEEELEVRIRSQAIKNITDLSSGDKGYQASKYLADKGWKAAVKGRPSKASIEKEARVQSKMYDEFKSNITAIK